LWLVDPAADHDENAKENLKNVGAAFFLKKVMSVRHFFSNNV
jgi:hypothetical protein